MNQSYRVVWQTSTHTCCVVSEQVRTKGKSKSSRTQKMLARIFAVSLGLAGADAALADTENTKAENPVRPVQSSAPAADKNHDSNDAFVGDEGVMAVRRQASEFGHFAFNSIFTSNLIAFSTAPKASSTGATASGNTAQVAEGSPAQDNDAKAAAGNDKAPGAVQVDSISAGKAGSERQITNLAAGTADTDAVNLRQVKNLVGDGSAQHYLKVNGTNDGSDDAVAGAHNASAIGPRALAAGASSVAIGDQAKAQGIGGIAIGQNAAATEVDNIAIGSNSTTESIQSIAIGARSQALGPLTTVLGYAAGAGSVGALAIGSGATVGFNSDFSISVGTGATISDGSKESTALGAGSGINGGSQSLAAGYGAMAFGNMSTALGAYARVGNDSNTAVGFGSHAGFEDPHTGVWFNSYATALGAASQALATGSIALGADSSALAENSVALGYRSLADRENSVSVGSTGSERQITNLAAGTADTDAVNVGQLKQLAGDGSTQHYFKVNARNDGSDDSMAAGDNSIAAGSSASAIGDGSSAFGTSASASGIGSLALGAGAAAIADPDKDANIAIGANARAIDLNGGGIAIGTDAVATGASIAMGTLAGAYGSGSVSLGSSTVADGNSSIAIGGSYEFADGDDPGVIEATHALGRNSIALGASAYSSGDNSVAIGPRATASGNGSVALGVLSYADRDNTVSVGNILTGSTRQITNVAAGVEENDAVNVRQMNDAIGTVSGSLAGAMMYDDAGKKKMTLAGGSGSVIDNLADGAIAAGSKQAVNGSQLHQVGDSVAQMLGGGAMMGVNGFTGPVFGVQGGSYSNVGDALGALDGALDSLGNRVSSLENGGVAVAENTPKPVAKMTRNTAPPVIPTSDPGTDSGKDIVTQEQLDDVKDYVDAGDKQTLGSANQYTDRKVADKVSQSDFNEFKGNVDQRFDKVNKKISRVGAMASAMAGMAGAIAAAPPNENRVSASLGGYGGQTALSLGYARRISNSGALLIGGSIASGGESSGTVGVSFGW